MVIHCSLTHPEIKHDTLYTEEHENKYTEIRELNHFYLNEQNNLANIILLKNRFFFLHTIVMRSVCDTSIVLHTLTRFSHDPGQ